MGQLADMFVAPDNVTLLRNAVENYGRYPFADGLLRSAGQIVSATGSAARLNSRGLRGGRAMPPYCPADMKARQPIAGPYSGSFAYRSATFSPMTKPALSAISTATRDQCRSPERSCFARDVRALDHASAWAASSPSRAVSSVASLRTR
jgi:hypothetical protein